MAFKPCSSGGRAISFTIANQKARSGIDRPAPEKVQNHPRRGLTPVAGAAVFGKHGIGVKRAVANIVEMSSYECEVDRELRMQRTHIIFSVVPTGDSGLVADDEHKQARVI